MKSVFKIGLAAILSAAAIVVQADEINLIPLPQKMEVKSGAFVLNSQTRVFTDWASRGTAKFLTAPIRRATGLPLKRNTKWFSDSTNANAIFLTTKNANTNLGPEGYELTVLTNAIVLRAPTQAGLFYGVQTLLQLLPPQIFSSNQISGVAWTIPSVAISDSPRFKWRGLMLDCARHFYTKAEVEKILDTMALYKLNRFHWHLTDDQGWRIEIKKYPKLTQIGAWRDGVGFGLAPNSTTNYRADGRYGGFYTQKDIREVVAYAAARHITVVPEIEMPGHATAALVAYPRFASVKKTDGVPTKGGVMDGVYNPANPATFQFLDDVLTEVFRLFPGKYIHVGGDEVPARPWKSNPDCVALMQREGLTSTAQLESWFIRRIEKFVNAHGKTLIGWSEIAHGGLAQNAVVMDWIGGGYEAASAGHDVVMTPTKFCYFDYYQSTNHATEPKAIGGFIPLKKVYSFEPVPEKLTTQMAKHILGPQGNLWTEYISNLNYAEYMIFPRELALAEVGWSPKAARNWGDFQKRLKVGEQRLDALGVNYRRAQKTDQP